MKALIAEICSRISIAEAAERCGVALEAKGRDHTGPCPFCGSVGEFWAATPITEMDPFYHCFSCKAHGNVVGFWMRAKNVGFRQAINELAELAEIPLEAA